MTIPATPSHESLSLVKLSDLPASPDVSEVESAYRRGYTQGYWQGTEDVRKFDVAKIDDFYHDVLMPWRFDDTGRVICPPEMRKNGIGGAA